MLHTYTTAIAIQYAIIDRQYSLILRTVHNSKSTNRYTVLWTYGGMHLSISAHPRKSR